MFINLKTFTIVFFSISLITSNILSKSISICHEKSLLSKKMLQNISNHKHCNQKKEKKLVSICLKCDCNQNQVQLIVLNQSFEINVKNKSIISIANNIYLYNPNNLDPPPKTFL